MDRQPTEPIDIIRRHLEEVRRKLAIRETEFYLLQRLLDIVRTEEKTHAKTE